MTRQTKDQQVKQVVEGLALGVLAYGVRSVSGGKVEIELAFNRAWRSWAPSHKFPAIKGVGSGNQIWLGMGKSEGRVGVRAGWESHSRPYLLDGFDHWNVEECLELLADDRASVDAWKELGKLLISELKSERVQFSDGPAVP